MCYTQSIFEPIERNDIVALSKLVASDPGLLYVQRTTPPDEGQTPLQVASQLGHIEIVEYLVSLDVDVGRPAQWGYPAVWHAYHYHQTKTVALLLSEGSKQTGPPGYGLGIDINLSAREGMLDIVREHIRKDPLAVYRRGVIGETPLHWAAHNGHNDIVLALLAAGANIEADEIGLYGGKPLHWASEHKPEITKVLIERGALINSRNHMNGRTPLIHCACQHNDCAECAEILISSGADRSLQDQEGKTALDHAHANNRERIAALLKGLEIH